MKRTEQIAHVTGIYKGAISLTATSVFMVKVKALKPLSGDCVNSFPVRSRCGSNFKIGREYVLTIRKSAEANSEWEAIAVQA